MNRALISALLSIGVVAGSAAAQAQTKGHPIRISESQAGASFQPVRGAIRIDAVNVPFEVKIDATQAAADSSTIEIGGDHWEARGYDLKSLIAEIFDVDARLVDVPDAMVADQRYDVSLSTPVELDEDSVQRILVKALAQRFGVSIRPEARTMDVYVLSAPDGAGSGLKRHVFGRSGLKKLVAGGDDSNEAGGRITYMGKDCSGVNAGGITVEGGTIADFRHTIESELDRVVVDETKLHGSYDFRIGLYANQRQLFELMRVGLGLVMKPEQRPVTVLAVRPAEAEAAGAMLEAKLQGSARPSGF
jgi:uncharacterized protein (TIGR03435 family)